MAEAWELKYLEQKRAEKASGTPVAQTSSTAQPTFKSTIPTSSSTPSPTLPAPKAKSEPVHGKYMSGGVVSKAFDILRTPEYILSSYSKGARDKAVEFQTEARKTNQTGLQKYGVGGFVDIVKSGVKNIIPGVSNRSQLGREEGDYNFGEALGVRGAKGQTAVNFGSSLAIPAAPVTKIVSKGAQVVKQVPGAGKVGQVVQKGVDQVVENARTNPKIYEKLEKLPGLEYFRNPEVGKILEGSTKTAEARISGLYNKINDVAKGLSRAERIKIGNIIEGGITTQANTRLVQRANYIRQLSDDIGRELVESGLMSKESFAKFGGKYLAHIADVVKKSEMPRVKGMLNFTGDSLKKRGDKLGKNGLPDYIREFQYPTFKALSNEIQNVESVKALKEITRKYGLGAEDFNKSIKGPRVSDSGMVNLEDIVPASVKQHVKGMAVPQEVAEYITRKYGKNTPNLIDSVASKALDYWKLGKTVYSGPAYHVRNLMSNQILSDFATGAGLPKTIVNYGRAVKAYLGKGDVEMTQYLDELKDAGVIGRISIGEGVEKLSPNIFNKNQTTLKKVLNSPKKFQTVSEETAKLNVYAYFRNKGMSIQEAVKKAEEAIFSPYNMNKTEKGLVKNIVPFYSFTRQALPFTVKTAVNKGNTLTKYEKAKTAVEGLSPEGSEDNISGSKAQVRLPIKDKNGNYIYADPSYILPYGNFENEGKGQGPFGLGFNPLLTEFASQVYNKDLYFDQPIAKSNIPDRAKAERIQHGIQTFAPNILPTDFVGGIPSGEPGIKYKARGGSKLYDAFTEQLDYAGRTRNKTQAVLDTFGLKSASKNPDQSKFDASAKSKKLKAIQSEYRTILNDKRLSADEKKIILQQLRDQQKEVLSQ